LPSRASGREKLNQKKSLAREGPENLRSVKTILIVPAGSKRSIRKGGEEKFQGEASLGERTKLRSRRAKSSQLMKEGEGTV